MGRKKKGNLEYRIRWDDILYEPGELKAVAYKDGNKWAEEVVFTTEEPFSLQMIADRSRIVANGKDLSFISVKVIDSEGRIVPDAVVPVNFTIEGLGDIVATDNGNAIDMTPFHSTKRDTFSGQCLVIVRGNRGNPGEITIKAESQGLKESSITLITE